MLKAKVAKASSGLYEVQLLKDDVHHMSMDETLTKEQAEHIKWHVDYLLDRLNYLEPLQAKYEEALGIVWDEDGE